MRAVNVEAQACNTSPWLKEEDREFETNLSYVMRLYFGGGGGQRIAGGCNTTLLRSEKDVKNTGFRDSNVYLRRQRGRGLGLSPPREA